MFNRLAFALLVSPLASSACTADVRGEGTGQVVVREQKRTPVTGKPAVALRLFNGSIRLRSWDRSEILLDIERRASSRADVEDVVVEVREGRGEVRIEAKWAGRRDVLSLTGWSAPSVNLTVTLPRHLNVEARTGDSSVRMRPFVGELTISTGRRREIGMDRAINMVTR